MVAPGRGSSRCSADVLVAYAYGSLQQKRRNEALERQRTARARTVSQTRNGSAPTAEGATQTLGAADGAVNADAPPAALRHEQDMDVAAPKQDPPSSPSATDVAAQRGQESRASRRAWDRRRAAQAAQADRDTRAHWAALLQQPEWLTDVPHDLSTHWLVMARPEGPRCLVVTSRGQTVVRGRNGAVLATCLTCLPGGGPAASCGEGARSDTCVLEAIWHMPNSTLYITDLLSWKGYEVQDCSAEFRVYWLRNKLTEHLGEAGPAGAGQGMPTAALPPPPPTPPAGAGAAPDAAMEDAQHAQQTQQQPQWARVAVLASWPADAAGLQAACGGGVQALVPTPAPDPSSTAFQQDGLYFLHRESRYTPGAATPLALAWKDGGCSAWPVDTDASGVVQPYQQLTLEYRMDATVATSDDPPVVLGAMPAAWVQAMGPKLLKPGTLLRFRLQEGGIMFAPDGQPCGADLHYEGPAHRRRGRADAFSKILFQHMARTRPLTLRDLLDAVGEDAQGTGMHPETAPPGIPTRPA